MDVSLRWHDAVWICLIHPPVRHEIAHRAAAELHAADRLEGGDDVAAAEAPDRVAGADGAAVGKRLAAAEPLVDIDDVAGAFENDGAGYGAGVAKAALVDAGDRVSGDPPLCRRDDCRRRRRRERVRLSPRVLASERPRHPAVDHGPQRCRPAFRGGPPPHRRLSLGFIGGEQPGISARRRGREYSRVAPSHPRSRHGWPRLPLLLMNAVTPFSTPQPIAG